MAVRSIILTLALLLVQPAWAAEQCRGPEGLAQPAADLPLVPNEFRRSTGKLGCALPPKGDESYRANPRPKGAPFLPCLRIGAVAIGDRQKAVEALLGVPDRITPIDDGIEARVYFIRQRGEPLPYYVVTYLREMVVAIQLIGPPTEMPATFSSLSLGSSEQAVIDVLGQPSKRCRNRDRNADTWYYPPFPIAVEMGRSGVVGFRVTVPVEKQRD